MLHALLPNRDLTRDVGLYIVSEDAFPAGHFLRPNVLCFCLDRDAVLLDGQGIPGPILGNSFNSLPQTYEKRDGTIVLVQMFGGAWWRLFGIDPARFSRIEPLDDSDCQGLEQLLASLKAAGGDLVAISGLLDAFFLKLFEQASPRGLAERARAEIVADLDAPVGIIAGRIGVTERTLQRAVRKTFGVSPTRLKRIIRLFRSRDQGRGLDIDWLHVPGDLDFADQSHWIKEFRKLQGMTPSQYRAQPYGEWAYYDRGKSEPSFVSTRSQMGAMRDFSDEWRDYFAAGASSLDLSLGPSAS
ncbi:helix-turn-helix domain-containing protein [Qipengyuania sphaerica]|uniref:helix-turn-helix domain-containing protein n=1 Tax=Qipengyuania sphaerica TaxID=2867243 RepID=UPI001C877009|nr:AraC family transcriptional regulator [Qipengyuania sphaerica]MBX7540159.1 AraC family transcriptional regulator [Qipengyuania sphaerica]